jgi:glycosyltransferase involved in cell wall biosynthesis
MKVMIAYFGSYGSGADITNILYSAGKDAGDQVYVEGARSSAKFLKFSPMSIYIARRNFIRRVSSLGIELVIFPMSNPIDLLLGAALKKNKVKCIRLVHDLKRHPGDLYPPTWVTKRVLKDADGVVCLSNFVHEEIKTSNQGIRIVQAGHPYYFPLVEQERNLRNSSERKILFIGRGGKYKGLSTLLDAWPNIGGVSNTLTIAGEHKKITEHKRVNQVSGWLSDLNFHKLIHSHDLLVFPYAEASQSGIIPLALQYKKPVIVLPVGGLPEQVTHLSNGVIANGPAKQDLIDAVNLGLNREWNLETVDVNKSHNEFYQSFKKAASLNSGVD